MHTDVPPLTPLRSGPSDRLVKVPVEELERGMYVAQLDRPWLDTPFSVQGFYLRNDLDVRTLCRHCRFVYIDPRLFEPAATARKVDLATAPPPARARSHDVPQRPTATSFQAPKPATLPRRRQTYTDNVSMRDEFFTATRELQTVTALVTRVFDRLRQGKTFDLSAMAEAINPIIGSVLRNKDALAALVRIKRKDNYTYSHCISTSVWATILGRHLGLDRHSLQTLALSCALLDIGKIRMPRELLTKPGALASSEMQLMREHAAESVKLLRQSGQADRRVIDIVAAHHERHDGSGYPLGLAGGAIPLGARIAGLADSYDAMTTERPYAKARSSYEAMQELAQNKDIRFQGELVEQLIQAIGLFPTGSLVELSSGEVAIVVGQNPSRRLKPKVVVVLNGDKTHCAEFPIVDLFASESRAGVAGPLRIARELPPGAYGIDAEDYYL